ncbi:RNA polymerase sigma factor [Roseiconus lacunae]|uniref:Sigma-70 family RNA polymerase sigma factor n=1 Tax=Roseiconus lacunae TaxID=2605694 RepID=A0ABT7PR78_9BACT|nr:sigma-70 family RNA polymerase sigma factor [Roseiconus lacunae]MCD0459202.1 sigma-70 family RNA polymerase sigma factor [Roseiconus lacunae]MDM4019014.1 sigma-70 family RNA polymerase sigma factor [Roseiconus lacunae]WRQ51818.1 sigma-70 family RNA polymerase sigma factor [Stieleria sp. HD01]
MIAPATSFDHYLDDQGVQLMLQLQQGELDALDGLMDLYSPLVTAVVRNVFGSQEPDEDVSQEVFLRVFQSRDNYVPTAKFCTWLSLITKNYSLNIRRNRARRKAVSVESSGIDANLESLDHSRDDSGGQPTEGLDRAELDATLRSAIERLIPRQREAIEMVYYQGMSYSEVARRLDTSPPAIKSLLARARSRLRELLPGGLEEHCL